MEAAEQRETQLVELLRSHNWDGVRQRLATQEGALEAGTRSRGGNGCFPLCEISCVRGAPNDVIISLVNSFPDALLFNWGHRQESSGNVLMEYFFRRGQDIPADIMQAMILAKPECLWFGNFSNDGGIFLHRICSLSKNVDLVRLVLESYPEGASIQDSNGMLPLHLACKRDPFRENATSFIIQMLLEKYPIAAEKVDRSLNLPLHYACHSNIVSIRSLNLLLDTYPTAAEEPNDNRQKPLHVICRRQHVDLSFLLNLIKQNPECLMDEDIEGMTPFNVSMDEYEKSDSKGSYEYPETNYLDVAGILLYCIYKHHVLEEETPLEISEAKPRSKRERMLCLGYTAHLMHPKDFHFFFDFTVFWGTGVAEEIDDFEVDDHEWFPGANGEEEAWEGNTPLHLLWNDMSTYSSRAPRQCYNRDPESNAMSFSDSDDEAGVNGNDDEAGDNGNDGREPDVEMHIEVDFNSEEYIEDDWEESYPLSHTKVLFDRLELNQRQRTALASHRNDAGELPLHRLLKYGRQGAIFYKTLYYDTKILVGAYPESCFIVEPHTNFYPFMIAARNAEDEFQENEPCLSTIFFLLKRYVTHRQLIHTG